ncbi:MFS-type transporter involved in bile tolerance (Atg22 family) [Pseudochelatococcus contaminans]|uniref:MFS-type transporter involved in bile tolerance (Atg22 family) n=1 Tax=Pseudochelatococcus contaminans TaxID=1538103 RepID=A0A7W5Z7A3_9HYPH|nr:MFS-type transporter involved in bile tolerance (Atg22 family) [Pseudochelatococcus contaminans]
MSDAPEPRGIVAPLVHNERTKLTSTYLNGIAIATFAIGALAPTVSVGNGSATASSIAVTLISVICITASLGLHFFARHLLGRLEP